MPSFVRFGNGRQRWSLGRVSSIFEPQSLIAMLGLLALSMCLVRPASATIAYVQGAGLNPNTGSSVSVTFTAAQTAGNFNIVTVSWDDTTSTVLSITDTNGNKYVQAGTSTTISGTVTQQVYYATNIGAAAAGTNTVTVGYSKSVLYPEVKIAEYSGISTTSPFDGMSSGTGTGTAIISGSLTTTNANDLLVADDVVYGTSTAGDPNYTSRDTVGGDLEQDRIVSAVGTYTASDTQTPSSWWLIQLVAFKAASSAAPTTPSALTVTPYSTSVNLLSWGASTSSAGVKNYPVQRCSGTGCSSFAQIAAVTSPGYVDSGLTSGMSYSYRVQAQDVAGNVSGFSGTSSATPAMQSGSVAYGYDNAARLITAQYDAGQTMTYTLDAAGNRTLAATAQTARPQPPTNLVNGIVTATQVPLSWTASTSTGVTGYQVFRGGCAIGPGTSNCEPTATPSNTATSFTDTTVSPGTAYTYWVVAYAGIIDSPPSTALPVNTPAIQPPTAPGTLTATAASYSTVNLSWGPSTDTGPGQPGLAGYHIYRGTVSGSLSLLTSTTSTTYSDTTAASGTTYYYAVASYDTATPARVSNQVTAPAVTTLYQIVNPTGTLTSAASSLYNMVTTCPPQQTYCKYDFYQTYGLRLTTVIAHETDLSLATCSPSTTVTNLATGYSVASDCSVQAPGSIYNYPILPSTPTGFVATVNSYSQITLTWASGTVDTKGPGLGGFVVIRNGAALPEVGATALSYIDSGLAPSTVYTYTVESVDTKGVASPASPSASQTTPAVTPPPTPTNFQYTSVSSTQTNLTWTEPSYTGGSGIKNYIVMRQIGSNGTPAALPGSPTTSTSISDDAVVPGTSYIYTVSAQDNSGQVSPAASVSPSATPFSDTPVMTEGEWDNDGTGNYLDDGFESGFGGSMAPTTTSNGYTYQAFFDSQYSIQAGEGYKSTQLLISGFTADPGQAWLTSATAPGATLTGSAATYSYTGGVATWRWTTGPYFGGSGSFTCTIVHK